IAVKITGGAIGQHALSAENADHPGDFVAEDVAVKITVAAAFAGTVGTGFTDAAAVLAVDVGIVVVALTDGDAHVGAAMEARHEGVMRGGSRQRRGCGCRRRQIATDTVHTGETRGTDAIWARNGWGRRRCRLTAPADAHLSERAVVINEAGDGDFSGSDLD